MVEILVKKALESGFLRPWKAKNEIKTMVILSQRRPPYNENIVLEVS